MLAYVTMHLVNHATGLVSLTAMERVLSWVAGLWSSWPMQVLLYGAFLVHYALAVQALWQRRTLRLRASEIAQLALGFAIPILLARHVVGTRISHALFGTDNSYYAYMLWVFFVRSPELGALQMLVLVVAWTHAMLGLHFWLRSKPAYERLHEGALVVAVLVPVLALLGMIAGGR
jgi:adenylate cyclase